MRQKGRNAPHAWPCLPCHTVPLFSPPHGALPPFPPPPFLHTPVIDCVQPLLVDASFRQHAHETVVKFRADESRKTDELLHIRGPIVDEELLDEKHVLI